MNQLFENPLFSIIFSIAIYSVFSWIQKKTKLTILNPLLLTIGCIIMILNFTSTPYTSYNNGGSIISLLLAPATASIGLSIYRKFDLLKANLLPILVSCSVGALTSIGSIVVLCKLFHFDESITFSLVPKSVTTPIAMEISRELTGIPAITVAAVIITGIMGAIICPVLIRIFNIENPTIAGAAIGTCSHAVGTSKALELGETQGAISGVAIGITGILTVIFSFLIF